MCEDKKACYVKYIIKRFTFLWIRHKKTPKPERFGGVYNHYEKTLLLFTFSFFSLLYAPVKEHTVINVGYCLVASIFKNDFTRYTYGL